MVALWCVQTEARRGPKPIRRLGSAARDGAPPPPGTIDRAALRFNVHESPDLDAFAEPDVRLQWCRPGDRMRARARQLFDHPARKETERQASRSHSSGDPQE